MVLYAIDIQKKKKLKHIQTKKATVGYNTYEFNRGVSFFISIPPVYRRHLLYFGFILIVK